MIIDLEQLISRNYGRKNCGSTGAILGSVLLPGIGTAMGYAADRQRDDANSAAKRSEAIQAEAIRQSKEATANAAASSAAKGQAADTSGMSATKRAHGVQSTYLASRLGGSGNNNLGV